MKRREFERVTPESVGIHSEDILNLVHSLLESGVEMHGLMIMRHGKVCAEGWWTPYESELIHGLQSMTKTYTATALGIAYTEGLVRLDERIIDIFPEESPKSPDENLKLLTVRDLLCMGTGMVTKPDHVRGWVKEFLHTPVVHKPGSAFFYNSMGTSMLGEIIRKKTGMGLMEYLTPRLFDVIGIDAQKLGWYVLPDGMEYGGGGLYATTEDNLRLMKLYADGGLWEGKRVLASDYVEMATSVQNDSSGERKVNPPAEDNFVGYGFQIWMCRPEGVYRADGAMGQYSIVFPKQDMIIAVNETAENAVWAQNTLDILWNFAGKIKDEVLEEDVNGYETLKNYLSDAQIPIPFQSQRSAYEKNIRGNRYCLKEGHFDLDVTIFIQFEEGFSTTGITEFSLDFEKDRAKLSFLQDGKEQEAMISLNGTWQKSVLKLSDSVSDTAYFFGTWRAENEFEMDIRWAKTCFTRKVLFTFDGYQIRVYSELKANGKQAPFGGVVTDAVFQKEEE